MSLSSRCPFAPCRDASPDERAQSVSPREGRQQPDAEDGGLAYDGSSSNSRKAEVTPLVRGHYGSVLALGVFEGLQEYVTAGYDRYIHPGTHDKRKKTTPHFSFETQTGQAVV